MTGMTTLKAVVKGKRLIVEDAVDYPDGTQLELAVVGDIADQLDDEERAARDAAIETAWKAHKAGSKGYSKEESLALLRARR